MMPNYTFINRSTKEQVTYFMTWVEREEFIKTNPEFEQTLTAPAIADSVRLGVRKIDRGFNDVLQKAKNAHLHSTIETL
jgi:hypothetical protein